MEKNGFATPRKGYLAFYIVDKSKGFIDRLPFRKEVVEIETNPSDVYGTFKQAKKKIFYDVRLGEISGNSYRKSYKTN